MARILVVDEASSCAELAACICKDAGHRVSVARTSSDALTQLAGETFDLVLLGIYVPLRDGYELMVAIRSRPDGEGPRFAVITAHGDPLEHRRFRAAGAEAVLLKPYSNRQLRQVLASVLEQAA